VRREVRRDAVRVLGLIDAAIARSDGVILFPEGTTSPGSALLPLKPALLEWAAQEQYPVHYAVISYRTGPEAPPAEQAVCWWGAMPFGSHLMGVLRIRRFEAIVDFAPQPMVAATRGELAARLQSALAARLASLGTGTLP
jgi:1-acyl-sn-glycerol-3-phosphate acyltransferase